MQHPFGSLYLYRPTNNASSTRTHNVNVSDGSAADWTKKMPWRAPGSAAVLGSGSFVVCTFALLPNSPSPVSPRVQTQTTQKPVRTNLQHQRYDVYDGGTEPVKPTGCGVAGGGDTFNNNGGWPPTGMTQGADTLSLPAGRPTVWSRGSVVDVAWGMWANHGGGYSYVHMPSR